jgi:hypothetical protein
VGQVVAKLSADRVKGLARVRDPDSSHNQASEAAAAAEALIKVETLVVAVGVEAGGAVGTGRTDSESCGL